ncbi:hypothetical protein Tsp_03224 [Trichinella spiralis]|uniref:hypothetical protein n=1 Tax=Trichinella spiralis TaxID=6334 RepID=UPI0001EFC1B3|nr:hypothetical protein Tsp_03224 [Trichinella spiralis]
MRWAMSVTQCRTLFADNFEIAQTKLSKNVRKWKIMYMWILWHLQQCSFSEVWMDVRAPVNSEQVSREHLCATKFAFSFQLSIQELLWIALQQNLFEEIFDCISLIVVFLYKTSRQNAHLTDYDDMQHRRMFWSLRFKKICFDLYDFAKGDAFYLTLKF